MPLTFTRRDALALLVATVAVPGALVLAPRSARPLCVSCGKRPPAVLSARGVMHGMSPTDQCLLCTAQEAGWDVNETAKWIRKGRAT